MPQWIDGLPNASGLWIVEQNGEFYAVIVEWDADENDEGGLGVPYLRFSDDMTSEPLVNCTWKRSYGPIPMPDSPLPICSCRVPQATAVFHEAQNEMARWPQTCSEPPKKEIAT